MAEVERKNYSQEDVNKIIEEFPIELLGDRVVITVNTDDTEEISVSDKTLSEEQYVVALGPMAKRSLSEGDKVILDFAKLMVKKPVQHDQYQSQEELDLKPFVIGDYTFAEVTDSKIKARYKNV